MKGYVSLGRREQSDLDWEPWTWRRCLLILNLYWPVQGPADGQQFDYNNYHFTVTIVSGHWLLPGSHTGGGHVHQKHLQLVWFCGRGTRQFCKLSSQSSISWHNELQTSFAEDNSCRYSEVRAVEKMKLSVCFSHFPCHRDKILDTWT